PGTLVGTATGRLAVALAPPPLRSDRPYPLGRRRSRGRTPRQEGLRQGPAPRRGPQQSQLHRLSLRPQVGRPGRPGLLPFRPPTVGLAGVNRPLPLPPREPPPGSAAQNPRRVDAVALACAVALVSRSAVPFRRRQWLWQPCRGVVRCPTGRPVGLGQSLRGRCQPLRSAA